MATVAAPIDATSTAAWKALEAHQEKLEAEGIDLKAWFAADAVRVNKLGFDAGDLHFDLSKNLVTDETVKLLCDLAREVKLEERRDAMFSGEHINTTEDRAVLHTALRRPASEKGQLIVDGQDVVADVHEVLDRMYAFADIHVLSPRLLTAMHDWPDKFGIIDFYLKSCATHNIVGYAKDDLKLMDIGKLDTIAQAEDFLKMLR